MTGRLRVDISTQCQLRCPSCPTAEGLTKAQLGAGFMSLADFRRLLDENPWVHSVDLANWGESLLAPELPQILRYAFDRGIALSINAGANLNHLPPDLAEALVRYRLEGINCAIDAATAETYARYRVGGDFNKVIENVRLLNSLKKKYQSQYPRLRWQFVAFGHNEHEIEDARVLAGELGMDFHVKLSWDEDFSPVRDVAKFSRTTGLPAASRSAWAEATGKVYSVDRTCFQLWSEAKVNWNGEVYGCTWNDWASFGNAFDRPLQEILEGEKMSYAKRMVQGLAPERADIPCTSCSKYRDMKKLQSWVKAPESRERYISSWGRLRNRAHNMKHVLRYRLSEFFQKTVGRP